jgi:hypothetical protein
MRTVWFEIVAGGAGICYGVVVERGWGTARHMMHKIVASIIMTIMGRPELSGAGIDLVHGGLTATHGVVPGRLGLMVLGWSLAGVAAVRVRDVGAVGPAVV